MVIWDASEDTIQRTWLVSSNAHPKHQLSSSITINFDLVLTSEQVSFDYTLFKKPQFVGLLAFGVLSMLGYIVLLFSLPRYVVAVQNTCEIYN